MKKIVARFRTGIHWLRRNANLEKLFFSIFSGESEWIIYKKNCRNLNGCKSTVIQWMIFISSWMKFLFILLFCPWALKSNSDFAACYCLSSNCKCAKVNNDHIAIFRVQLRCKGDALEISLGPFNTTFFYWL